MPDWGISESPNLYSSYESEQMTRGLMSRNHVSQWNPLFSIPMDNQGANPYLTQEGLDRAAEYGRRRAQQDMSSMSYNNSAQTVASIKGMTEGLLKDENLTAEQKKSFEEVVKKVEEMQKKLEELRTELSRADADVPAIIDEMDAIGMEAEALKKIAAEKAQKIYDEIAAAKPGAGDDAGAVDDAGAAGAGGAEDAEDAGDAGDGTAASVAEAKTTAKSSVTPATVQGRGIAKNIFFAIDGPGTDNDKLKGAMDTITKGNVVETLDTWNTAYSASTGGETMLESIYSDVSSSDTRKEYTEKLLYTLNEKAVEKGIDLYVEVSKVEALLNAWWRDDSAICRAIEEIHQKLGGKPVA